MKKIYFLTLLGIFSVLFSKAQHQTHGNQDSEISITVDFESPSTNESKDGSLSIKVSGGKAPYTINYFTPYSTPKAHKGAALNLKDIITGEYIIVVQDAENKTAVKTIAITSKN